MLARERGEHRAHGPAVGHVGGNGPRAGAQRLRRRFRGLLPDIVDDDARALRGEALADGVADAGAAAGDQGDPIF